MRFCFFLALLICRLSYAQKTIKISLNVVNEQSYRSIPDAVVTLEGFPFSYISQPDGQIDFTLSNKGEYILVVSAFDYISKRIPIVISDTDLTLGFIYMSRDITPTKADNLITLVDEDSSDDFNSPLNAGMLQATKDVFLSKAAFDFGQAFFRVRGYDSNNGEVLINGISMNKLFDGRPQWNNWGGLNDVTRNQEFTNGLNASDYTFGGIMGNTNIDTRPSRLRPGFRFSSSFSNRTYAGRLIGTYTSKNENGMAFTLSSSRRWAKEGYLDGTLYDAYALFGSVEYKVNEKNAVSATAILASNRRGRSSAITEEVYELKGSRYNPYWGIQNGNIRNSRERKIAEPIFMVNQYFETDKISVNTGVAYQFGINSKSRMGYYRAPNPDPTYYRYLPSYYINSSIGANFTNANLAKNGFLSNSQLQWDNIYTANNREPAAYVLYDDVSKNELFTINSTSNLKINDHLSLDFGVNLKTLNSNNYDKLFDLLGAEYHLDIDPFTETSNNLEDDDKRYEGDIFNYHYKLTSSRYSVFTQIKFATNKFNGFVAGNFMGTKYQREGVYRNGRYSENSLGKSANSSFNEVGFKGGLTYRITGRHWIKANGLLMNRPPFTQNVFINPRENNLIVPNLTSEKITSLDLSYFVSLPDLKGRLTSYYTRFQEATDINFFFVDSGVGSDFVQEVITNMDKLHMGAELGIEYDLSSAVKLSFVAGIGQYLYANDPNVTLNFDTAGREESLINTIGAIDLQSAKVKGLKLAQGPQKAYAFGINYRDPKYWWAGATASYLSDSYVNISTIQRTSSFYIDPSTEKPFVDATDENVAKLLKQKPLADFYVLNLVGGKSWKRKSKYISAFISVNNVFDEVFRTGGYEQSRNGYFGQLQQDNLSESPSFGTKYWYGYGRTYFLNLAYSF